MAMVTGMDPEAVGAESELSADPKVPGAAALDADSLTQLVAQAVAAQNRPWRSTLLTALATTILAGLIAVAAAGYTALRADITALRTEVSGSETGLRTEMGGLEARLSAEIDGIETRLRMEIDGVEARLSAEINGVDTRLGTEIQDFRAEVNATLLDHTDRLARLETDSQRHTEQLTSIESALQLGPPAQ
ncbi:hypothetical protein [Candidatus Poriferisodalis sp.]|uniref:hypothetical protein n=1 Tax=Candidatus Poriferisodalis sp. TaxID=3101277 RepID=UPI003B014629